VLGAVMVQDTAMLAQVPFELPARHWANFIMVFWMRTIGASASPVIASGPWRHLVR